MKSTPSDLEALSQFLPVVHVGKVRVTLAIPEKPELLLVVVTNRISTHNVVHKSPIPRKGMVLTAMTIYWLRDVLSDFSSHLVASGREIYRYLPKELKQALPNLHHQAMVIQRLDMVPVEFILRRYLVGAGSLYREYQAGRDPYGLQLPPDLPVMYRFGNPVFTPTDKSETDDPLMANDVGICHGREFNLVKLAFQQGEDHLAEKGICLLDSKFEVGRVRVGLSRAMIADEILTPDSSRFADLEQVREGADPPWLDKEFIRTEAIRLWGGEERVPLSFSSDVVARTAELYDHMLRRVTGHSLDDWISDERFDFHANAIPV